MNNETTKPKEEMMVPTMQQAWVKNQVTYVPHYTMPDKYVGPGWSAKTTDHKGYSKYFPTVYTLSELIAMGAVSVEIPLWPRGY